MTGHISRDIAELQREDRIRYAKARRAVPKRRRVRSAAVIGAALAVVALVAPTTSPAATVTKRFTDRGETAWYPPEGVASVRVHANGEKGGNGQGPQAIGGFGDLIFATLSASHSSPLFVQVGIGGGVAAPYGGAGNGGGASGISVCSIDDPSCRIEKRYVVAAGGGGAGGLWNAGGRGGAAGQDGGNGATVSDGYASGGRAGTQRGPGARGFGPWGTGNDGQETYGGVGAKWEGSGGGGGGYYGGGSGAAGDPGQGGSGGGGGGGGYSYVDIRAGDPHSGRSTLPQPSVELIYDEHVAPHLAALTPGPGDELESVTFGGIAGTDTGDGPFVRIDVYAGGRSSGTPVESFAAVNVDQGRWSQSLDSLQPGMYTAVASQTDEAGNKAYSSRTFFKVAPKPKPPVNPPVDPPANPPANPPVDTQPADQPAGQRTAQDEGDQPAPSQDTQASAPRGDDQPANSGPVQGQRPMEQRSTLSLAARSQKLRTVLRKGLATTVTCDGTCATELRVVLPAALAKRYGFGRKAVVIASGHTSATSGHPARVTLRITGRARRALRRARSLRLHVQATSPGSAPVSRTVTVR